MINQKIIAAYADPNRRRGKNAMTRLIDSIRRGVPAGLEEIAQLGLTLWRRREDILAFFDHHASNGPTEAINGRVEALRRNAPGFRNLTHYRWRSLPHGGALHSLSTSFRRQARPTRYMVPANDTHPLVSTIRVTTIPLVTARAVRRPRRSTAGVVSGLRRCTCEATNTHVERVGPGGGRLGS